MSTKAHKRVVTLCDAMQKNDDALGQFSDYEGYPNGPTYYLWNAGYETFAHRAKNARKLHEKAIRLWDELEKLNEARKADSQ